MLSKAKVIDLDSAKRPKAVCEDFTDGRKKKYAVAAVRAYMRGLRRGSDHSRQRDLPSAVVASALPRRFVPVGLLRKRCFEAHRPRGKGHVMP